MEEERRIRLVSSSIIAAALLFFFFAISPIDAHHVDANLAENKLFTKYFQESLFDITGRALYSVEVLLNDKEYELGKNVMVLWSITSTMRM